MPRTYTVQDTKTGREITFDWNGDGDPTDADLAEVFQAAGEFKAEAGRSPSPSPSPTPPSLPEEIVSGAGRYAKGFAKAAIPNPAHLLQAGVTLPQDQIARATGAVPGDLERAGVPGGSVIDKAIAALEFVNPGLGGIIGTGRGMAAGSLEALLQGSQGVQQGDSGQVLEALGKGIGTTLPALVGVGGRVPGVGRVAAPVEAALEGILSAGAGKLAARAKSAQGGSTGRPPGAPQSVEGVPVTDPSSTAPIASPAVSPATGAVSQRPPRSAGPTAGVEVAQPPGPSGVRGEPPVPAGHTRLYRGEGTEGQLGGGFYTRDPKLALAYSEGPAAGTPGATDPAKGRFLTFIDVPDEKLSGLARPAATSAAAPGTPDYAPGEYVVPQKLEHQVRAVRLPKRVPPKPVDPAKVEASMQQGVDAFLDDVARSTGSLEEAGLQRGRALATREKELRDRFSADYEDVFQIAEEQGAEPSLRSISSFVESLNPVERTKLKALGVELIEREVGDVVIEPPETLGFRDMHALRSRALAAARAAGPDNAAKGAAKKVASLAREEMEKAASSSPELHALWRELDTSYRQTFGARGDFYGTVLKKIARDTLDKGVPPEKSHRLLFGASLQDVRALKSHLPEMDVRRMFRDALDEALRNPDGSLVDPAKMMNKLRSPRVFGRDVLREGLGERHEAALDRLVAGLKAQKADLAKIDQQLQQRAAALTEQRTLQSKLTAEEQKAARSAAVRAERDRVTAAKDQQREARAQARAESLESRVAEGNQKIARELAFATLGAVPAAKGAVKAGALLLRVMAHPKASYALAKALEEAKGGNLTSAGVWSSRLDDALQLVLREQDEERRRTKGASQP